jgi:hypothetical protein
VVLPFYQKAVSFCDFMGLFFPNSIKKRGDVSPVGATAFAFGIVKSPCYEFTHSDFTIPTATGRRYIPAKTIIDRKSKEAAHLWDSLLFIARGKLSLKGQSLWRIGIILV